MNVMRVHSLAPKTNFYMNMHRSFSTSVYGGKFVKIDGDEY